MYNDSTANLPYVRVSDPDCEDSEISLRANNVYKVALSWRGDPTLFFARGKRGMPSIAEAKILDKNPHASHFTFGENPVFTLVTQEGNEKDEKTIELNSCFFTDAQNTVQYHDPPSTGFWPMPQSPTARLQGLRGVGSTMAPSFL